MLERFFKAVLCICTCLSPSFVALVLSGPAHAQKYDPNNLPRLPGAELLVAGYAPERHLLTTEDRTVKLPDSLSEAFVSISADGRIVGCVRPVPGSPSHDQRRIISTYSVKDGRLTDHLEITGFWGSATISPDGEKMAYVTSDSPPDHFGVHLSLRLLDFKTGKVQVFSDASGNAGEISWSPDGRRIVVDMESHGDHGVNDRSEIRTIRIVDIETGTVSEIGVGGTPSWSPSGDWIAYVGYVPTGRADSQPWSSHAGRYYATGAFELRLMSPDGTHSRRLMRLHSGPNLKPIWSPDTQTLLFQVMDPDTGTVDIYIVDVAT